MKISPARVAAFEVLKRIETERAFSSVLLPIYEENLSSVDRGLCHELVLGVLRKQIYLDKIIGELSNTRNLDVAVRIALRLGAYQLLFLDKIPAYSAINESVNLVQRARKTSAKGLVNAVLRKVSAGAPSLEYADDVERVSVETSHPRWLLEKWAADFGSQQAEAIARANNRLPQTAFRVTRKDGLEKDLSGYRKSGFVAGCYFAESMDAELLEAANSGEIYFQDEASQLVAEVAKQLPSKRYLDVCAAPGGKTTQVASGIVDPSAFLFVAGDLHDTRINVLRSTLAKQSADFVNVVQYDAESGLPFADGSFDTILVDAPCSGTGTIRHNPEIRYFIRESDFSKLGEKQLAILRNASNLVQPGGTLIYSTCSLQVEENEAVCKAFISTAGNFEQGALSVPLPFLTERGFARTFPDRDDMDGFFIAQFRRS